MDKFRRFIGKLKISAEKNFTFEKIFKRKLLKLICLAWLTATILFGGFAIWKAAATPGTRIYPQIPLSEILQLVKQERVERLYLKYDNPETANKLVIFARLKTWEIFTSPIIDFNQLNYTEIIDQVKNDRVEGIIIVDEKKVLGWTKEKNIFMGSLPMLLANLNDLSALLTEHQIQYWELRIQTIEEGNFWGKWGLIILLSSNIFYFLVFLAVSNYCLRHEEHEEIKKKRTVKEKITFDDVAGIEEAKSEIVEILDFIKFPEKYLKHGAKMPRGALLVGPPGCGKTLLAKALAGEADVPFKAVAGSEFVEKYVGTGASRVRNIFGEGRQIAHDNDTTFILFIDEIDALGTRRMAAEGDAEYAQTITQVLHEMDGLEANDKIFVLAATNCPENLDPAIRRPGRFDRQIIVQVPDLKGRKAILEVHCKNKKLNPAVDLRKIAELTPLGFSGADLANAANEAAIRAARLNKENIETEDFEKSIEKVLMGSERKSAAMSDQDKWRTAWHEAGHAVAAKFTPGADPPQKISIIPTTKGVGGFTQTAQNEEKCYWTKQELLSRIMVLFGGRIAEELAFGAGNVSTGAREDFRQATQIAEDMICDYGMAADMLGPRTFGTAEGSQYLGRSYRRQDYSEGTAKAVDLAKKKLLTKCYKEAEKTLEQHFSEIKLLAESLKANETLNTQEINQLLKD